MEELIREGTFGPLKIICEQSEIEHEMRKEKEKIAIVFLLDNIGISELLLKIREAKENIYDFDYLIKPLELTLLR